MNLTDEKILELAVTSDLAYKFASGRHESPYIEGTDLTSRYIAFARAILKEAGVGELEQDVENYLSVMAAAAVEINEQWTAHCDEEGYGPVNLMRRLEQGFPEHYGYRVTEWEALCADAARYRFLEHQCRTGTYRGIISRAAIDEAMKAK